MTAFGQAQADPWLIVPSGEQGSINARTTRQDLVRLYGPSNVVDQDIDVGEGDIETATVLFPNNPKRMVEILWQDQQKQAYPNSVIIYGKASRWHTVHGISLGMSYSELARLNGKPFAISWGTCEGNVVASWEGGQLDKDLKDVSVWFDDIPSDNTKKKASGVSRNERPPTKGKRERRVNQIAWGFRSQIPH
jgi:hypothetical protein